MSYQGSEWVRKLRGVNRGEKAVLMQIGCHQDQRTNMARVSVGEIALDARMSERQVTRILQQLEGSREGHPTGILHRNGGGNGRGNVAIYSLVGFKLQNADRSRPEKVTFSSEKGDIPAQKADIDDSLIRNRRNPKQVQEQNHHGCAEMKIWRDLKEALKTKLGLEEWNHWVRPIYLLKVLSGTHFLLAAPPNNKILHAYKQHEAWLRQVLGVHGYSCSLTAYPEEWELKRLALENLEWREIADRLLCKKQNAERVPA